MPHFIPEILTALTACAVLCAALLAIFADTVNARLAALGAGAYFALIVWALVTLLYTLPGAQ